MSTQNLVKSVKRPSTKPVYEEFTTHDTSYELRFVDNHFVDVFLGRSWANWTRLQAVNGRLKLVAGASLPKPVYNRLVKDLM